MPYDCKPFDYVPPAGLTVPEPRHPVVIVGAGPIGLAAALDLAQYGVASVILDDNNVVSVGSRAICWSKRSLEILDRLGIGERCAEKGVTWQVGRTFHCNVGVGVGRIADHQYLDRATGDLVEGLALVSGFRTSGAAAQRCCARVS